MEEYINKGIGINADSVERTPILLTSNDDFLLKAADRKYNKQFYSMYQYRLNTLKQRVDANAMRKWGNGTKKIEGRTVYKKDKILDITSGEVCWVSGTVFSDLHNKLNILKDVEKGVDDTLPTLPSSYVTEEENKSSAGAGLVMLEDESGRAILHNDEFFKKNLLVSGCIVAILGVEVQAGIFEIMDIIYPTVSEQSSSQKANGGGKIAIVSGLNMSVESESNLKIDLLKQFLSGEIGGVEEMEKSSKISRLIIAGDSISPETTLDSSVSSLNFGSKNVSKLNVDNIKEFDNFLQDLLPTIPITLMPGSNDPGEICLPQQPLHRAFLQKNKQYVGGENLQSVTNPTWLESDSGLKLLGSSGQNIDDIKRYLTRDQINEIGEERLESVLLEYCLKWQNIAPSAPDTLYCYPFEDSDPFTLSETPHIFFAGNQDKFGWEKVYFNEYGAETKDKSKLSITVVSIPRFSESGQLVLIDEETLECEAINF